MKSTHETDDLSYWQLIFMHSKVNGAPYYGDELPGRNWDWPKDTYLQRRLQHHRFFQSPQEFNLH